MGSASNYTVDRHQHKGAERGPPPFSHTLKNESVCCRSELCLYSIYSFCPQPLFSHQWGLKCWWKPGGKDFSVAASESSCSLEGIHACWMAPVGMQNPPRVTEQQIIGLLTTFHIRAQALWLSHHYCLSLKLMNNECTCSRKSNIPPVWQPLRPSYVERIDSLVSYWQLILNYTSSTHFDLHMNNYQYKWLSLTKSYK